MDKEKLGNRFVAGVFIFDLIIIALWAMIFFWHVMLGLAILGVIGVGFFFGFRMIRAARYVDDHIVHHN